jgi:lysozyme family protein
MFVSAFEFVLAREGLYSSDPDDPGGATMMGVTQRVYDAWRLENRLDRRDVRDITRGEVGVIYQRDYWRPSWAEKCDALGRPGLALCTFDWAVNAGVMRGKYYLQLAVGTVPDGAWGPNTREAVSRAIDAEACTRFLRCRALHYWARIGDLRCRSILANLGLPSAAVPATHEASRKFLRGWLARLRHVAAETGADTDPLFAGNAHAALRAPLAPT